MAKEREFHPAVKAFDGPWFAVPTFFTEDLMRVGRGIPNSFWKLTFVIWRDILKPKKNPDGEGFFYDYTATTTFEQLWNDHGINEKSTQEWQAAYYVSGLFNVKKGTFKRKGVPGEPTVWRYNPKATKADWLAFILALRDVTGPTEQGTLARRGSSDNGKATTFFQSVLAVEVDKRRSTVNGTAGPALPPVNEHRIALLREALSLTEPQPV